MRYEDHCTVQWFSNLTTHYNYLGKLEQNNKPKQNDLSSL